MTRTLASETPQKIDSTVTLKGWVATRRDHGKVVFFDLRDRSGIVQVVGIPSILDEGMRASLAKVGTEDVVSVTGKVRNRPKHLVNPNLPVTGEIEIQLEKLEIVSPAKELPFPIDTDGYNIEEEIRLKYRYLDIRRPRMTRNLKLRSQVTTFIRNFLTERDFLEVETPILTKTTPEGARDFLVPSRLQKGNFYAF